MNKLNHNKMKKGYWIGNVIEIKNEERWNNYLTKYFQIEEKHKNEQTKNYLPVLTGQPKGFKNSGFRFNVCKNKL